MNKNNFFYVFLFFCCFSLQAQELLTVEEAVRTALENNYEIKLAKNALTIDEASVSPGLAGMLPSVDAVVTDDNSIQNISQTRSDGTSVALDNSKNTNLNYGVVLDWTIFDGLSMFARYDQLKEMQKLGEAELQLTVLNRVSEVMVTYFDIVQQQQQLQALDSSLVISEQRVDLADNRFSIGKSSKLEVLNAQVDLNTDQTLFLRQKELYRNTKIQLNELLARDIHLDFVVVDEISVDESLFLPELETLAQQQNPQLLTQLINKNIAELQLKQVKASRYPTVVASTGYTFNESTSGLGFTTNASAKGWNYGLTARLNIFDGFNQNRTEKIAKLQLETTEIAIAQQKNTLLSQLGTTYQTYTTNLNLIELEKRNEAIAKENLEITLAKYRIGSIPTIEFRTAQLNYINATVRYSNSLFEAKLSEIRLRELAGNMTF